MALTILILAVGTGSIAYLLSLITYRLFFSPLSRYPGPFLASISYAYEFYFDAWLPGDYIWQIQKLHARYGPIVRVNPNEIHINDPTFYDEIYAPVNRKRNVYDWSRRGLDAPDSLGATVDHNVYRMRREALNPFWSRASISALEPMMNEKIDLLCNRLLSETGVVNLSDAFVALTVHIIGQFSFGKDYAYLRREDFGGQWRSEITAMMRNAKVLTHFNWLTTVIKMMPEEFMLKHAPPAVADLMRYKKEIRAQVTEVLSGHDDGKDRYRTIFHHLRDNPNLPAAEKSGDRLQQEGQVLVLAGSETTAKTLSIIVFHLLNKPEWLERVTSEVRSVLPKVGRPSWNALEKLPCLTAVIHEGLRLNFGITGRNQRYTVDETLQLGGHLIPPGVPMSMMSLFLNANKDIFPEPFQFKPERWLEQEPQPKFLSDKQKYLASFGRGSRRCIAINLAYAELYLTLAAVVTRLKPSLFETDESDVTFKHDFTIMQSKLDSEGVRVEIEAQ